VGGAFCADSSVAEGSAFGGAGDDADVLGHEVILQRVREWWRLGDSSLGCKRMCRFRSMGLRIGQGFL
jgi:hypothetical protein